MGFHTLVFKVTLGTLKVNLKENTNYVEIIEHITYELC